MYKGRPQQRTDAERRSHGKRLDLVVFPEILQEMPFYSLASTAIVDASNDWFAPGFIENNISVVIKMQKNQADKHPYILRHYVFMVSQTVSKGNNFQAFFVGLNKKIHAAKFNRQRFLGFAAFFASVPGIFTFLCSNIRSRRV